MFLDFQQKLSDNHGERDIHEERDIHAKPLQQLPLGSLSGLNVAAQSSREFERMALLP